EVINMARLYVGNLPETITEHDLQAWLEERGFAVESVQVIRDLDTGGSRGFAFVELPMVVNASEAVESLNGQRIDEHNVRVSEARPVSMKTERRPASGPRPKKRAS